MTTTNATLAACLCPVCGASPCFAICPEADPFGGDQVAEGADYEFNARYDADAGGRAEAALEARSEAAAYAAFVAEEIARGR